MAIFRTINMGFWTDTKVVDDYTPEDRYFMLYALTNNYTNIIGCYEISIKQMSNDLGYSKDVVEKLIDRFRNTHKTIDYDYDTKELIILNWNKYNWNSSPKLDNCLLDAIEKVKSSKFHDYLAKKYNARDSIDDTLSIGYRYPSDTTITNTNTNSITNTNSNNNIIKDIIDYLNYKINTNYKYTTRKSIDVIKARLNEGFTIEDFKIVIDKKSEEWLNDVNMNKYLRPETLFGTKFESYLNQKGKVKTTKDLISEFDFSEFS